MTSLLANWKLILILVLTILLASVGILYKNSVETVGQLKEANGDLSRSLKQAEVDKENLSKTLETNSRISEQDELDRKKLSDQVVQLNSSIDKLSKEKNVLKRKASESTSCDNGDAELSDELKAQLRRAYEGR